MHKINKKIFKEKLLYKLVLIFNKKDKFLNQIILHETTLIIFMLIIYRKINQSLKYNN